MTVLALRTFVGLWEALELGFMVNFLGEPRRLLGVGHVYALEPLAGSGVA